MKYAVVVPCDQTIGFLDSDDCVTIKHPEVKLFSSREEAETKAAESLVGFYLNTKT